MALQLGLAPDPTKPAEADNPKTFVAKKGGIAGKWASKSIDAITRHDVLNIIDAAVDRGAPMAANRTLALLKKLFGWCVSRGLITSSPTAGIQKPAAERSRDRVLADRELRAIWQACDRLTWPFGPFVRLVILTGQRRDEVASITRGELDLQNRLWAIPAERAKNGVAHGVLLSAPALAIIEAAPIIAGDRGLIFTTNGRTAVSGFSKAKRRLDELALALLRKEASDRGDDPEIVTLPDRRLHDIRRTVATGMARLGINLPVIEKVLNHVSGSFAGIVGVYQRHKFEDEKRKALEAWASFVSALVADKGNGNVIPMRAAQ